MNFSAISQALCNLFSLPTGHHVSTLRLTYMLFAFPSTHGSREILNTFQLRVYFGIISLMGRGTTGVACITQSNAWHSITTHASAGSSYLGQTPGPLWNWSGSSQTSVLVKVSIQKAGEKDAEPHRPYGKRDHWCHLPV